VNTLTKIKPGQAQLAFTMIDSAVGMGVLGIVLISLFGCFAFGFNVVKISRDELRATQIVQEKMEAIRLYSWKQLNQTNYVKRNFQAPLGTNGADYFFGQVDILTRSSPNFPVTNSYAKSLRLIKVSLTWTNNGLKHMRQTSTLVSQHGLQNYVYNP
jgi:hypothetical protein